MVRSLPSVMGLDRLPRNDLKAMSKELLTPAPAEAFKVECKRDGGVNRSGKGR